MLKSIITVLHDIWNKPDISCKDKASRTYSYFDV